MPSVNNFASNRRARRRGQPSDQGQMRRGEDHQDGAGPGPSLPTDDEQVSAADQGAASAELPIAASSTTSSTPTRSPGRAARTNAPEDHDEPAGPPPGPASAADETIIADAHDVGKSTTATGRGEELVTPGTARGKNSKHGHENAEESKRRAAEAEKNERTNKEQSSAPRPRSALFRFVCRSLACCTTGLCVALFLLLILVLYFGVETIETDERNLDTIAEEIKREMNLDSPLLPTPSRFRSKGCPAVKAKEPVVPSELAGMNEIDFLWNYLYDEDEDNEAELFRNRVLARRPRDRGRR